MQLLPRVLALAASLLAASAALAQPYPSAPVTMVVPFAAGSGTDAVARVVAKKLGERLRQPVLIDNRAGANAQIGAQYVAKAKPDGYTLFMTTNTSHSANPSLTLNLKYDPIKDFTPVARVGELPFALVVNKDNPARTLREWITQVKAQPGKLSYATPNSTSLVASETIKRIAGLDVVAIPYKSSPQALTDLIGGSVQMYVVDLGSGMGMINAGSVKVLGVTTKEPLKSMPNVVPIVKEVPGFDLTSWNGIFGPAGMPKPIVDKLNLELQEVLADQEVQKSLGQLGFETWPTKTPEEFAKYVSDQLAHWTTLVKQAGITPQ
ncbi:Bug family tripartite tricarboxylate transporter substrate binding protein [Comamonas endophytica]|uniref:Tripartite tricarboxylate transporter substrate binding protein n=1 Tax=Comamonas endophytica TaxID=2949090 RepID=A0ABY6GG37_9BURK|nr:MULTISPECIES: tripartite tricarboxylate transporter substrate binding protein [unclassified Acidovorax]MCD2513347.1 tripartite tricarboxylate transporter substrate binding protein [Acidovorax sp. D4N7]UYG53868.1 tripartite tricarboxylate transporter substrate binding protein [Acidovorax sp. 5MLIR]